MNNSTDEDAEATVLRFIHENTLVGLLPMPHPIVTRRFERNPSAQAWFTTFMWHLIYTNNSNPPMFKGTESFLSDANVLF